MSSLPVTVLFAIAYALLVGSVVALAIAVVTGLVRYYTDTALPSSVAITLSVVLSGSYALAGLGLGRGDVLALVIGAPIVALLTLFATTESHRTVSILTRNRRAFLVRPIRANADPAGLVSIESTGTVRDIDGYPPLPRELRRSLERGSWRVPSALSLSALESRLEDRLQARDGLEAVSVTIDRYGRASIAAAPPAKDVSKRVPEDCRAVTLTSLVPAGLAVGDLVRIETATDPTHGTVVSVSPQAGSQTDGDTTRERRTTIAVPAGAVRTVLELDTPRLAVVSDGTTPLFETLSLLEQAGTGVRRLTLDTQTRDVIRTDDRIRVIGVRRAVDDTTTWQFDPALDSVEDEVVFVIGDRARLAQLEDVTAVRPDEASVNTPVESPLLEEVTPS